jgi:protein involved in ribonucleotide reduction
METVNILTFTDGLDNGSTSPALKPLYGKVFAGKQSEDYLSYIRSELINRIIGGKRITAFSVGVRGNDVNDLRRFTATLMLLASNPDYFYELTDFSQLDQRFLAIAQSLKGLTVDRTFVITTPAAPGGTKIKMTFDIPYDIYDSLAVERSARYLEGIVEYANKGYSLTNVMFGGDIGSSTGAPVLGEMDEYEVKYTFKDFRGYNQTEDHVRQWLMPPGSETWQVNSEYRLGASDMTFVEQRSGLIYLVLDSSTSLSDADVDAIRDAAKGFITTLYAR